jgi:hypothetical protein
MPTLIKDDLIPTPVVFLVYGATGAGRTSVALRSKGKLGNIYLVDSEKQSHLSTGPNYDKFMMDPVETTAEAIKHIRAAGSPSTAKAYGNPKTLVIDTITVLKEDAEIAVEDKRTAEGKAWGMADWTTAKRPIRKLALVIKDESTAFNFVFLIARQKPEYEGTGNSQKPTGKMIPDVIRGFDYTPNVVIEVIEGFKLLIKKTKPSIEKYFPMNAIMTYEKFYEGCAALLAAKESEKTQPVIGNGWEVSVQDFVRNVQAAEIRTYAQLVKSAYETFTKPVVDGWNLPVIGGMKYASTGKLVADFDNAVIHFAEYFDKILKGTYTPVPVVEKQPAPVATPPAPVENDAPAMPEQPPLE